MKQSPYFPVYSNLNNLRKNVQNNKNDFFKLKSMVSLFKKNHLIDHYYKIYLNVINF